MTEPVSGSSLLQAQDVQRAASHNHVHHNTHTRHHHIRSHHQHKVLHQRQKEEAAEQQRQQQRQQEEESRELPRTQPQSQQPSPSPSLPAPSQSQVRNQTLPQSQPVTPPPPQQQQQQPEGGDSSIVHVVQTVNIVQLIDASGATVGVETFTSLPTTTSFVNSQPAPASSPLPEATPVSSSPPKVAALDSSLPEATQIAGPPKAAVAALPSDDAADVLSSILPTTAPSIDIPALVPMSPFPTVESFAKITSTPSSGSQPALSFSGSGVSNSTISSTTTQPPVASSSLFSTTNGTATDAITASSYRPSAGTNLTTSALPSSSGTVLFNGSFTTLDPTESSLLPATSSPSGAAASGTGAITSTSTSASATLTPAATTFTSDGTTFTSDGTTFTFDGTTFSSDAITPSSAIATTTSPSPSPSSDGDLVGIFGGGAGGGASSTTGTPPAATTTGGSGGGSDSPSNPSLPGTVAGSVLGGIAGVAFILVLALVVLRWKKRQMSGKGQSPRGLLTGAGAGTAGFKTGATNTPEPGPGSGPGDHSSAGSPVSRTMTQRSSLPFIPASLANLKGSKRYSDRTATSSETGEKGFQKVSGRKLPSVLHYGGDGYTEPGNRDTVMSEASSYRDSIAMFTGPGMPRLALGSPMRPESGIVVFHDGPSRTPQQSTGAFSLNLEPPARDPLGRSHPSQDGSSRSHGSFSRFTEQI